MNFTKEGDSEDIVDSESTKDLGTCTNCNQRPATGIWLGHGSVMDYAHGNYTYWCEQCMVEAQVQGCREAAERLSGLEARLAELQGDS